MLDPAVLRAMAAAGASIEVIIAAVEADCEAQEAKKAAKRANNAERQRRFKARQKREVTDDNAGNALPSVTPLSLPPNENISNPPTHTPGYNTPRVKGLAKPEGVSEQIWADFLAHRKAKRAPVTETVLAGINREASRGGWTLEAALAETVFRGWQTFKLDWAGESARHTGPPGKPIDEHASLLARLPERTTQ